MPAAICLAMGVFTMSAATGSVRGQGVVYLLLVPCFSLLGSILSRTRTEVRELRQRLAELEGKRGA